MSSVIDEKVVEMRFDNQKFEENVQTSLDTLDRLKSELDFQDSEKSLSSLSKTANDIDFSNLDKNIRSIADRFSTAGIVGMKLITDVTSLAERKIAGVTNGIKNMIVSGGISRAMNIEKAKFQLEGLGVAWKDIESDINYGVQDTAYGLDAAANVASQLVASNVELGDSMKAALRGVSGVAAMTASSYEEIGSIFTTVAGQGKLMTMQLRQLESRGINAAATLGKQLGYTEAQIRDMVTAGEISFEDFATAMDDAFGQHAKDANKTFTGVMSNIRSAFAKIGADFISPFVQNEGILVNFLESIRANVNSFRSFIKPLTEALANRILFIISDVQSLGSVFKKLNGWSAVWQVLSNVFKFLRDIVSALTSSFKTLILNINGTAISDAIKKFSELTSKLQLSNAAAEGLKTISSVLAGILKTIGSVIVKVITKLSPFAKIIGQIADSMLTIVAIAGRAIAPLGIMADSLLSAFDSPQVASTIDTIVSALSQFVAVITNAVILAIFKLAEVFLDLKTSIESAVGMDLSSLMQSLMAFASSKIAGLITDLANAFNYVVTGITAFIANGRELLGTEKDIETTTGDVAEAVGPITGIVQNIGNVIGNIVGGLKNLVSGIAETVKNALNLQNGLDVLKVAFTGVTAGGLLIFIGVLITVIKLVKTLISTIIKLPNTISGIGKSLKSIAKNGVNLKDPTSRFKDIAISIGILAASLFVLSTVPVTSLLKAGAAIGLIGAAITGLMYVMDKMASGDGKAKGKTMIANAASLVIASTSVLVAASAIKMLDGMDFESTMGPALVLSAVIGVLTLALMYLADKGATIITGAAALLIASASLTLAATSISQLAQYDWEQIIVAAFAISVVVGVVTAAIYILSSAGEVALVGAVAISAVLLSLAAACLAFGVAAAGIAALITAFTNALMYLSTVDSEKLNNITTAIKEIGTAIGTGLANVIVGFEGTILRALATLFGTIIVAITSYGPKFLKVGWDLIKSLIKGFADKTGLSSLISYIDKLLKGALNAAKNFINSMKEAGKNLIKGFLNGIKDGSIINNVVGAIRDIGSKVVNTLKTILGIHSPSTVMSALGVNTVEGFIDGIESKDVAAATSMNTICSAALGEAESFIPSFSEAGATAGESFGDSLNSQLDAEIAIAERRLASKGLSMSGILHSKSKNNYDASEYSHKRFNAKTGKEETIVTDPRYYRATKSDANFMYGADADEVATGKSNIALVNKEEEAADALAESYDNLGTAASGAGGSAGSASSEVKKSTDIMDYAADVVLKYKDEYVKLTDELGDDQALEISKSAVTDFAKAVYEAAGNTVDDTEDCMVKVLENFQTFQSDLTKSLRSQLSSLESFTQSYDISKWSIQSAFKTNKEAVAEWEKFVVDAAKRGVNQDYLINIVQGGFSQESYNKVRTFKTMTLDEIADFNKAIVNANNYSSTNLMTRLVNAYAQGVNDLQETGEKWISSNGLTLDTVLSKLEEASVNYEQKLASMKDGLSGVATSFDELSEAAETSADDILKNLQDRGEALEAYAENISGLYNMNLDKSFMAYIESLGFEGRGTVQAMIDAGEDKIHEIEEQWLYNSERESSLAESLSATWTSQYIDGMTDTVQALGEALKDGQISEDVGGAWLDLAAKSMDTYWGGVANMSSENAAKYKELLSSNIKQTVGSEFIDNLMSTMPQESLVGQITNNLTEGISSDVVKQSISDSFQETWQYCIDHLADGSMSSESVASLLKSLADQIQQSAEVGGLDEASMGIVNNLVEGIRTFAASDITQSSLQETFGSLLEPLSEITKSQAAQEALQNMTVSVNQSVIDSLTDKSTLDSVEAAGGMLTLAFSEGVVKNIKLTDDASAEMSRGVVETSEGIISYEQFVAIAWHIIDGLVDGIYDGRSQVVTAMADMVREAVEAAEEEAEIESPSHVMYRIGNFIDQGLANGVADNSKSVVDATGKLSQETISAFDTVILSISDYLENGINAEPTITPVLDMTNMEEGLRYSNSMFASQNFKIGGLADRARAIADELNAKDSDSSTDNGQKAGNTYQFVQNNYSPKALSRLDIYRQTHNQFARMKGLVEA